MHRKDMEAALDHGGEETNLDNCSVVIIDPGELEALEIALKELLSATRWRKTEEEPPEGQGTVLSRRHKDAAIEEFPASAVRAFPKAYPHWLPIPEVSE